VGIFGHSLGGRIAGALAANNQNIKAYISMEGIAPRRARLEGLLGMPVAMMCSSGMLPYAKDNYQTLIDGRKETVFMIELQKFGHNSVTDFPYVAPSQFNYKIEPKAGLMTSAGIVQAFFDAYLKQGQAFREATTDLENVVVTEYASVTD
jgi:dienelactone hydrolase